MRTTGEIVKELNKITERLQTLEPSSKSWGIYSQRGMALDWVLGDSRKESLLLTERGEHLLNDPLMYLRNPKTR